MVNKQVIGKRIHQVRLENGLTQDEFAKKLEVNRSAISQLENGVIAPSLELLNKITKTFSVSLDWLINGISNDFSKHYSVVMGYAEVLTTKASGKNRIMLPPNDETIRFLKSIIDQKEIEMGHSSQIIKYLEEKKQANKLEIETLKKLLAALEKEVSKK